MEHSRLVSPGSFCWNQDCPAFESMQNLPGPMGQARAWECDHRLISSGWQFGQMWVLVLPVLIFSTAVPQVGQGFPSL